MLNDLANRAKDHQSQSLRDKVWRIIFLSDTKAGKAFDVVLLWLIGVSLLVVMLVAGFPPSRSLPGHGMDLYDPVHD